jgi:hypothetical protein
MNHQFSTYKNNFGHCCKKNLAMSYILLESGNLTTDEGWFFSFLTNTNLGTELTILEQT